MIDAARPVRGILLDIEGTTSSIRFVYDEMFPFVRRELDRFLRDSFSDAAVVEAVELIAADAGFESFQAWCHAVDASDAQDVSDPRRQLVADEVRRQMDEDLKSTGLKKLQGLIWKSGFQSGELKAHVYPDVPDALERWRKSGLVMRIYSSGSVEAQRLFFAHTINGDLLHYFSGHDDTATGPKKSAESYRLIAAKFDLPVENILFISDSVDELDAACSAGMQTRWSCRPGNPAPATTPDHVRIESFASV